MSKFWIYREKTVKTVILATFFLIFSTGCTSEIAVENVNWTDQDIPFEETIDNTSEGEEHPDDLTDEETDDAEADRITENDVDEETDNDPDEVNDDDTDPVVNCVNANCSDKGFCFMNGGVPECFCQSGYHSEFPDCVENRAKDVCSGVECSNKGSCVAVEIIEEPVCACEEGSIPIGLTCISNLSGDPCDYVECGPNSECVYDYTAIDCKCETGFVADEKGWGCVEDKPDPCENVDCGEHGECKEGKDGSAECVCEKGYFYNGKVCAPVSEMTCDDIDCSGHGECIEAKNIMYCRCDEGYYDEGHECLPETAPECVSDFDCFYKCGIFMGSCVDSKCECF